MLRSAKFAMLAAIALLAAGLAWAQSQQQPSQNFAGQSPPFPLLAPAGSAAAPSYSFSGSTGTGVYWNGGNQIDFAQGGSNVLICSPISCVVSGALSTGGAITVGNGAGISAGVYTLTNALVSTTAPTISSGFGTSPAILSNNGNATFRVNVGTGGVASSGVIGLPAAVAGWNCQAYNLTAHAGNRADDTVVTASAGNSVTVQNQTKSTGAAVAWTASDTVVLNCNAF